MILNAFTQNKSIFNSKRIAIAKKVAGILNDIIYLYEIEILLINLGLIIHHAIINPAVALIVYPQIAPLTPVPINTRHITLTNFTNEEIIEITDCEPNFRIPFR
jgi:hypothetical protein